MSLSELLKDVVWLLETDAAVWVAGIVLVGTAVLVPRAWWKIRREQRQPQISSRRGLE